MTNTFIFMGRPGSGKGKQSELLAKKLECKVFSSGERLRELAKEDSVFGHKVADILNAGDLVPSWLASFIFAEVILFLKNDEPVVFDGIGRHESEARLFAEICEWLGRDFRVVYLNTSERTVLDRIKKRHVIESRTDDDNTQKRFNHFNTHTVPALEYFRSVGKVTDVDGEPLPDIVAADVWQKISN